MAFGTIMLTNRDAHYITAGRAAESAARDVFSAAIDDFQKAFYLVDHDFGMAIDHMRGAHASVYEVCDALDWTHDVYNGIERGCRRLIESMRAGHSPEFAFAIVELQRDLVTELNDLRG